MIKPQFANDILTDAMEAAQRKKTGPEKNGVHDPVVQRGLDLVTSIGIFEKK